MYFIFVYSEIDQRCNLSSFAQILEAKTDSNNSKKSLYVHIVVCVYLL